MRAAITWYDLLGTLSDASSEDIQQAYEAKADVLRPELLAGAPSRVTTAAARAQECDRQHAALHRRHCARRPRRHRALLAAAA